MAQATLMREFFVFVFFVLRQLVAEHFKIFAINFSDSLYQINPSCLFFFLWIFGNFYDICQSSKVPYILNGYCETISYFLFSLWIKFHWQNKVANLLVEIFLSGLRNSAINKGNREMPIQLRLLPFVNA